MRGSSDPLPGGAAKRRRPESIAAGEAGDDFEAASGGSGSEDPRTQRSAEFGFEDGGDAAAEFFDAVLVGAFDHHAGEGFGAAVTEQDAA